MTIHPKNATASFGNSVSFTCTITNYTETPIVLWEHNDRVVAFAKHGWSLHDKIKVSDTPGNASIDTNLTITNVVSADQGKYSCIVVSGTEQIKVSSMLGMPSSELLFVYSSDELKSFESLVSVKAKLTGSKSESSTEIQNKNPNNIKVLGSLKVLNHSTLSGTVKNRSCKARTLQFQNSWSTVF